MLFTGSLLLGVFLISLTLTMLGLGGGLIYSPLFALVGFEKSMVASTSLFLNLVAAASAAGVYMRRGMVDYTVALPLLTAGLSAPLGAMTTHRIDTESFIAILAVIVLFGAVRMIIAPRREAAAEYTSTALKVCGSALIGLVVGFIAGLVGIGGGIFIVPLLIYVLRVPTRTAAASNTFIVCFSSLTGFATHASISVIDWPFVLLAAFFSFIGGQVGSRLMAGKLQGKTVRVLFALVLLAMSGRLLYQAFG
ncbi:MAG: sulfite exporter TauE/SafE family protein [Desulfohalobiaceae bacterium]